MASLVAPNEESAKGKLDRLWAQLSHHRSGGSRSYPSHFEVYREICGGGSDYVPILKCPFDTRHEARSNGFQLSEARSLCPNGAVAKCKLEVFAGSPYTGVFGSGAEHCIVRLSTAIKPPDAVGAALHPEAYAASFASYLSQKMKRAVIARAAAGRAAVSLRCDQSVARRARGSLSEHFACWQQNRANRIGLL
jgi:hypothetical protein